MDPETKLLTDLLTRGVLPVEQFATEMARRSGFQPSNPRLADGFRAQGLPHRQWSRRHRLAAHLR